MMNKISPRTSFEMTVGIERIFSPVVGVFTNNFRTGGKHA
ncbi:MAG: hypothetical protein JWQ85_673 [Mucilaginibacter sp.]|nr:hypothetical protein [Mucilaginibacter sp.]